MVVFTDITNEFFLQKVKQQQRDSDFWQKITHIVSSQVVAPLQNSLRMSQNLIQSFKLDVNLRKDVFSIVVAQKIALLMTNDLIDLHQNKSYFTKNV